MRASGRTRKSREREESSFFASGLEWRFQGNERREMVRDGRMVFSSGCHRRRLANEIDWDSGFKLETESPHHLLPLLLPRLRPILSSAVPLSLTSFHPLSRAFPSIAPV